MKFKLPANVTADELFVKMQPVFISKYNWGIERGDNGELTILDKKYKYDVNLEEDGTFVIWWRMSVAKAFLSTRHYPIYKNAIATMGIIAYEVQPVSYTHLDVYKRQILIYQLQQFFLIRTIKLLFRKYFFHNRIFLQQLVHQINHFL